MPRLLFKKGLQDEEISKDEKRAEWQGKMRRLKDLLQKLLHIEDSPERTALAYSVGVFLGFSPFLGLHTLVGVLLAFLFRLNRVAVLLGVWSNTPWWLVPYYAVATWFGTRLMGVEIQRETLLALFHQGTQEGFQMNFWKGLTGQWPLLLGFGIGSLVFAFLLSLAVYPISLRWIKLYRSRKCGPPGPTG